MMRDKFISQPPEETEAYRKNMERIGNNKYNSKFWEIGLYKLKDQDSRAASQCFGMPVHQLAVIKAPPFYRLFIVRVGKAFKIGALLCTEPPCVD